MKVVVSDGAIVAIHVTGAIGAVCGARQTGWDYLNQVRLIIHHRYVERVKAIVAFVALHVCRTRLTVRKIAAKARVCRTIQIITTLDPDDLSYTMSHIQAF